MDERGRGAWHQGQLMGSGRATGFQLWVPMPPGVEDGPSAGHYVPPEQVPVVTIPGGVLHLLLGALPAAQGGPTSAIESHQAMNYFAVVLQPGASWRYEPPAGHTVAWAFGYEGTPRVQGVPSDRELLVFDETEGSILLEAGPVGARILVGSARPHDHALVLGPSSVHTSESALSQGLARIREIGERLKREAAVG